MITFYDAICYLNLYYQDKIIFFQNNLSFNDFLLKVSKFNIETTNRIHNVQYYKLCTTTFTNSTKLFEISMKSKYMFLYRPLLLVQR